MELKWKLHQFTFIPDDYAVTQTDVCVMDVHRGTFVRAVAMRVGTPFDGTTPTISIGDGSDAIGFMTTTEAAAGVAGLKNGIGEYLCTQQSAGPNANGKMYTEDDTIDLDFTSPGAGCTEGVATVIILYTDEVE